MSQVSLAPPSKREKDNCEWTCYADTGDCLRDEVMQACGSTKKEAIENLLKLLEKAGYPKNVTIVCL